MELLSNIYSGTFTVVNAISIVNYRIYVLKPRTNYSACVFFYNEKSIRESLYSIGCILQACNDRTSSDEEGPTSEDHVLVDYDESKEKENKDGFSRKHVE